MGAGHRVWQVIIPTLLTIITRCAPRRSQPGDTLMLTHAQIWSAIDRLAARAGLSASGLAKRASLDPTTFNKSKRITPEGRARWPSTESIAKALSATGVTI